MATLVLTAAGSLIGGPVGGALGAILGNRIDGRLLGKGRTGPRLGDLSVQTSSYGQEVPKLFGRMRVAGTVIWSTDIREDRHKTSAGKGQPNVTTYSYSVSFAVALSARPIRAVGRIWAEGKLLRGAAGDWKSALGAFRLHQGAPGQAADPLIAAAEGIGRAPAHRDFAYAVFEDLQLADFGNRIPSLTFEVEADAGPVPIATVAAEIGEDAIVGATEARVDGYGASGGSRRAALEGLASAFGLTLVPEGGTLLLGEGDGAAVAIDRDALGAATDGRQPRIAIDRKPDDRVPDEISLSYYDPARDWQAGLQRARVAGPARSGEAIELAAALAADSAKALTERRLSERQAARESARLRLPWRCAALRPGTVVTLPDRAGRWRIDDWALEQMVVRCTATRLPAGFAAPVPSGSAGRAQPDRDWVHGPTTLHLLDLPALDDRLATRPRLWVAAGGGAGWRGAALSLSVDGGERWSPLGRTAGPAVLGTVEGALGPAPSTLPDEIGSVVVALLSADDWLTGADAAALAAGANLAVIGGELVQFGQAEALGGGRFRLRSLWRGRRGTEPFMAGHRPGERFVLVEPDRWLGFDVDPALIGARASVMASGIGDEVPARAELAVAGHDVQPPSPVHLAVREEEQGDLVVGWRRRSRLGWAWTDGGDVPLGEERERYRVTIRDGVGTLLRTAEVDMPAFRYAAAERRRDGRGVRTLSVEQLGTVAASLPATLSFNNQDI